MHNVSHAIFVKQKASENENRKRRLQTYQKKTKDSTNIHLRRKAAAKILKRQNRYFLSIKREDGCKRQIIRF
ncbi:hypothetical protein DWV76_00465 [Segatella copri]|uniref:Uncharacterized protein n=1 Tax=Segatella copri TaxID=165179 RepID=A0AA92U0N2_9BACT|nr:hypothetical protein DWV76_00465 [Segatella copri]